MPKKTKGLPKLWQHPKYKTWYLRGTGEDGLTFKEPLDTKDEAEADRKRSDILFKMDKVRAADLADHKTVWWCLDFYEKDQCGKIVTSERAIRTFKHFRKVFPADLLVKDFTEKDRDLYCTYRQTERPLEPGKPRRKTAVGDNTIRTELLILLAALNHCTLVQNGLLKGDIPVWMNAKAKASFLPPESAPCDIWLTRPEAEQLLDVFKTAVPRKPGHLPYLYILGEILYGTGRRVMAAGRLPWDKINLKARTIDFRINGRETSKKLRGVARIPDRLYKVLLRAWEERDKSSPFVLGGDQKWTDNFQYYAIKAGFKTTNAKGNTVASIGPHTMRHTYITLALQAGESIFKVSKAVGCSVKTIEKVYGHHSPELLANVGESVTGNNEGKKRHLRAVR